MNRLRWDLATGIGALVGAVALPFLLVATDRLTGSVAFARIGVRGDV